MELRAGYQNSPENRRSHLHGQGSGVGSRTGKDGEKPGKHGEASHENMQGGGVFFDGLVVVAVP